MCVILCFSLLFFISPMCTNVCFLIVSIRRYRFEFFFFNSCSSAKKRGFFGACACGMRFVL